jgi:hypothetical protein
VIDSLPILSTSLDYLGVDREAIYEADHVAATLLRALHYNYKKPDPDSNQQERSLELLLSTLSECRPNDEDRKFFYTFGLKVLMLRTATDSPTTRVFVSKILTNFNGKC